MKQLEKLSFLQKGWFWFGLSFVLYLNTIGHDYAIDDLIVVKSNKLTQQGISGISAIFSHSYLYGYDGREDESYRPLTLTTFALEKSLFDANPKASHLIQVVLYGLLILVLFRFLSNLFGEKNRSLVILITLLYLLHPIHTEVVANVKSRDELLSALFLFTSLLLFQNWLSGKKISQLVFSLVCFFAAMLSKETAVLGILFFPAVIYFQQTTSLLEITKKSILFFLPFTLYFGIRSGVLSDVLIQDPIDPVANSLALASDAGTAFTTNLGIFAKYIQLALFPVNMSWDYSISTFPLHGFENPASILGLILLISLIGLLFFGLIKRHIAGFGALIFIATFALTSNFFFLINCTLGERFLFIPSLGILIISLVFLEKILQNKPTILLTIISITGIYYTGRTLVRNNDWQDNLHIYEAGIAVCPNSVKTHFNLGTEYLEQGKAAGVANETKNWYNKAIHQFREAQTMYPAYPNTYENAAYVFAELGKLTSDTTEKTHYLQEGLDLLDTAIDSLNLTKTTLFQNKYALLDQLLAITSDPEEKTEIMEEIVETAQEKPEKTADDYLRAAFYLHQLNYKDELIATCKQLVTAFPDKKTYPLELSKVYFEKQDFTFSLQLISIYTDAAPEDLSALSNKAMLLEITGKKQEARAIYEAILAKNPNDAHTKQLYENLKNKF